MMPPVEVAVSLADVRVDTVALARYVSSPDGPVYREMFQVGDRIKAAMKRLAPVSKPDPIPRRRPVTPGRLRDSIVKRVTIDGRGVVVTVGSGGVPYAIFVHEGTVPQSIDAKPGGYLVFAAGGRRVWAKHVDHPGNAPNRFMVRAAVEVLGASNARSV